MIFGKLIAGFLGLLVAGLPGLLVGAVVGHLFDRGLGGQLALASPQRLARMQQTFFMTSFQLLGHIAKADGRISEAEIAQAESLMQQLGIKGEQRTTAIAQFRAGAATDFDLDAALTQFKQDCAGPRQTARILLVFVISMALADSVVDEREHQLLQQMATGLGFNTAEFERLLQMVEAQSHFHTAGAAPVEDQLGDAYHALGVDPGCTDKELKRAYRRLMSEHHPDKLIARGVPESMVRLATEKAQEIQAAYDLVTKSRKQ